jgi:hypothetical protein
MQRVPLNRLAVEISAATGQKAPSYGSLKNAIYDGRIPAEKIDGQWSVDLADMPAILAAFGLKLSASVAA